MNQLAYAFIPVVAVFLGALVTLWRRPGPTLESALQHLAAGVVFGAAAVEILPQVKHDASILTTAVGGSLGVLTMLGVKSIEGRWQLRDAWGPSQVCWARLGSPCGCGHSEWARSWPKGGTGH